MVDCNGGDPKTEKVSTTLLDDVDLHPQKLVIPRSCPLLPA